MPTYNKPYNNILELIGNTPLIRLNEVTKNFKGTYFTKFEGFNPGHSNKDRIALHILNQAEKKGILKKGSTIIETTSGNTGFSLALVSLLKGYKCILAVSSKASKDKINMMKCLGAEIYVCPSNVSSDDPRSYYEVAKRLNIEIKDSVYINQYFNDLNIEAHYQTTGPEIWDQTNGEITHLISGIGTSGTVMGTGRYLKSMNEKIKIVGVQPDEPLHGLEGLKHIPSSIVPGIYNEEELDILYNANTEKSYLIMEKLMQLEGMFVGHSGGAVVLSALEILRESDAANIVCVIPDGGYRYLSGGVWW